MASTSGAKSFDFPVSLMNDIRNTIMNIHRENPEVSPETIIAALTQRIQKLTFKTGLDTHSVIPQNLAKYLGDEDMLSLMQVSRDMLTLVDVKKRPRYVEYQKILPFMADIASTVNMKERAAKMDASFGKLKLKYFSPQVKLLQSIMDDPCKNAKDWVFTEFDPDNDIHFIILKGLYHVLDSRMNIEKKDDLALLKDNFGEDAFLVTFGGHRVDTRIYPLYKRLLRAGTNWSKWTLEAVCELHSVGTKIQEKLGVAVAAAEGIPKLMRRFKKRATLGNKIQVAIRDIIRHRLWLLLKMSEDEVFHEMESHSGPFGHPLEILMDILVQGLQPLVGSGDSLLIKRVMDMHFKQYRELAAKHHSFRYLRDINDMHDRYIGHDQSYSSSTSS